MSRGTFSSADARWWAADELGGTLAAGQFLVHPDDARLRASTDGYIFTDTDRIIVDAKVYGGFSDWSDGLPADLICQMNHYRYVVEALTGRSDYRCVLAVLHRAIPQRAIYDVPIDPDWPDVVAHCLKWWDDYVATEKPPPVDETAACGAGLRQMYPRPKKRPTFSELKVATPEQIEMLKKYARLNSYFKGLESDRDYLKNRIKAEIGEAPGLRWADGHVRWTNKLTITLQ